MDIASIEFNEIFLESQKGLCTYESKKNQAPSCGEFKLFML